jgi:hypothetical protein
MDNGNERHAGGGPSLRVCAESAGHGGMTGVAGTARSMEPDQPSGSSQTAKTVAILRRVTRLLRELRDPSDSAVPVQKAALTGAGLVTLVGRRGAAAGRPVRRNAEGALSCSGVAARVAAPSP